ncbi:Hypothetical predicted protein [Cloeon dipterum]|uniref:BZIP domain-containing protein n=1 Tax=Cloeon dipterum TaxID=197152 RepID=A0A8S1DCM9_9INSE|nr:Hypothetical predicted protein [Cloeon dipterum]
MENTLLVSLETNNEETIKSSQDVQLQSLYEELPNIPDSVCAAVLNEGMTEYLPAVPGKYLEFLPTDVVGPELNSIGGSSNIARHSPQEMYSPTRQADNGLNTFDFSFEYNMNLNENIKNQSPHSMAAPDAASGQYFDPTWNPIEGLSQIAQLQPQQIYAPVAELNTSGCSFKDNNNPPQNLLDLLDMDYDQLFEDALRLNEMISTPENPAAAPVPIAAPDEWENFQLPEVQYTELSSTGPRHDWNPPAAEYFAPTPPQMCTQPAVAEFDFPAASSSSFAVQNTEVRDECVPCVRMRAVGGTNKIDKNDPAYKEHRRRNNEAVKKSRQKKALNEQIMIARKNELQAINDKLKLKKSQLLEEIALLRQISEFFNQRDPNIALMQ